MMTVRFSTGVSIQYNDANYALRGDRYTDLYTKKDGQWIAQVPTAGCVVEVIPACRVYQGHVDPHTLGEQVLAQLRSLRGAELERLKRALRNFNIRTWRWRP